MPLPIPEPSAKRRPSRRRRLILELSVSIALLAMIPIGVSVPIPDWLRLIGFAFMLGMTVVLSILYVRYWKRQVDARAARGKIPR